MCVCVCVCVCVCFHDMATVRFQSKAKEEEQTQRVAQSRKVTAFVGNRRFSRQPFCRGETMKQFCMEIDLISPRRENVLFLPSNMAAMT